MLTADRVSLAVDRVPLVRDASVRVQTGRVIAIMTGWTRNRRNALTKMVRA